MSDPFVVDGICPKCKIYTKLIIRDTSAEIHEYACTRCWHNFTQNDDCLKATSVAIAVPNVDLIWDRIGKLQFVMVCLLVLMLGLGLAGLYTRNQQEKQIQLQEQLIQHQFEQIQYLHAWLGMYTHDTLPIKGESCGSFLKRIEEKRKIDPDGPLFDPYSEGYINEY